VHGARLYGFALLVAAGDAGSARRAAAEVLDAGAAQAATLRHPERAAAWLRRRALLALRRGSDHRAMSEAARQGAVANLGVGIPAYRALRSLALEHRAAVVASAVEGLSSLDVATILGASPERSRRMVADGLKRYLAAVAPALSSDPSPGGELATRIRAMANQALGARQ
jgi:DNA-directed RNA polymerase specialized sigma24 family protein